MSDVSNRAIELLENQQIDEATALARLACENQPTDFHSWYAFGLCQRAQDQCREAAISLQRANRFRPDQSFVLLALGIAQQLSGDLDSALATLKRLVEGHPDYVLGYNSLGMTLKLLGRPAEAAEAYDFGAIVLARTWAANLKNSADAPRPAPWTSRNHLWVRYAVAAGLFAAVTDNMEAAAWPTAESAATDFSRGNSNGYYWLDRDIGFNGKRTREFQPNFFNSIAAYLRSNSSYSTLMGNRSTVLEMLGQDDEARQHIEEAEDFSP